MQFFTLKDLDVKDKRVLVRVDFNVPIDKKTGGITNDKRITATLPTIKYLIDNGARQIILMSHLGRPDGKVVEKLKMDKVGVRLGELIGMPVTKMGDCIDIELPDVPLVLLENLRFHQEEEENDSGFAEKLASLADVYVDDAFGCMHRAHASVVGVTKHLQSGAGFLVQKELEVMGKAMENPSRPFVAILGGAKVSDKIELISNLLTKCDKILIGGAMAYTFYRAMGLRTGNSLVEEDKVGLAKELLSKARDKIVLPVDNVVANGFDNYTDKKTVDKERIEEGYQGLDIGPKTIGDYKKILAGAKTIMWNGPLGVFEKPDFANGTNEIALYLAGLSAITIIGGGDSASAVEKLKIENKMTHVSTGGGASLEFLEGKILPGVKALEESYKL